MDRMTSWSTEKHGDVVDIGIIVTDSKSATFYEWYDEPYKALRKLMEYEDLEEQGKLLKLPCAIGDQVFIVWHKFKHGKYEGGIYVERFRLSDIAELGHTVFATREEAEVRLKEMKQQERARRCSNEQI